MKMPAQEEVDIVVNNWVKLPGVGIERKAENYRQETKSCQHWKHHVLKPERKRSLFGVF